jgi:hypothetical protein
MTSTRLTQAMILLAAAVCIKSPGTYAQEAGSVPQAVSASRTDQGILITSKAPGDEFSVVLGGHDIQPLNAERLELLVEGKDVEIVTIPFASDLTSKPDTETLAIYQRWILSRWESDGWHPVQGTDENFAFPSGEKSLLWEMQQQLTDSRTSRPKYRIVAATTNQSNIIALVGSSDEAGALAGLKDYLRAALLTLKRNTPEETPAPATKELLNARADLAQVLGTIRLITGHEYRALLNKQLMTAEDSELAAAIPVEPEVLIRGARLAVQLEGAVASVGAFVFDGKSAHAINLTGYEARTDSFGYWDPWGKGSFLAAGSNVAGVAATPDPKQERIWIIKGEQLEQVLYSISVEFGEMSKLAAGMPLGAFGSLGDRLDDARKTDLFTWFHLEQTGAAQNSEGYQVLTFKPVSPQFRPLVSLDVTTNDAGRLLAMDLTLLRSFIDDRKIMVFARDLAKSFLRSATPKRDEVWIAPLANQIEFDIHGTTVLNLRKPDATLPSHPTDDYLVFLGQKQQIARPLSLSKLTLTNVNSGDTSALKISLETMR